MKRTPSRRCASLVATASIVGVIAVGGARAEDPQELFPTPADGSPEVSREIAEPATVYDAPLYAEPATDLDAPPYGFYPTGEETYLLGGESHGMYPRSIGGINIGGPDAGSLTASGIWHQDEPVVTVYDRYDGFFEPLDNTLGLFVPRELALFESSDEPSNTSWYGYADPGFPFTRNFNPDLATIKAGPLYLDLISLSGTVLYSEYSGVGAADESDGWLSAVQLNFRGLVQITDNLYLTGSGQVYYLPGENELGFYYANGRSSFVRLAYETYYRGWEVHLFDEFRVIHRLSDIFDEIEHDEIETAGRYRFGRFDDGFDPDYFNQDSVFFVNRAGLEVNKDLNDWSRLSLGYSHLDRWESLDFTEHRHWDRMFARLDYAGEDWRFAPFLLYRLTAVDGWEQLHHSVYLGARGPLSENIRLRGKVGYFHSGGSSVDSDRFIGDLAITHHITDSTSHSLSGGVSHYIYDTAENWLATFARYSLHQDFGARLRGTAYVQYSELEGLDTGLSDREGWISGASLTASISDYTNLRFDVAYDNWSSAEGSSRPTERSRWIYRAALHQRLLPYLYARLLYQYEDYTRSSAAGFDEHLYMLTITHLF